MIIMKILVMNGPNLQLLGRRKAEFYGTRTLPEIETMLQNVAVELGVEMEFMQSNHEGVLVDRVAAAITEGVDGIVINPAAYTHTSVAIADALSAVKIPTVEVHISNVMEREAFRHHSFVSPIAKKTYMGLGFEGYRKAIRHLALGEE